MNPATEALLRRLEAEWYREDTYLKAGEPVPPMPAPVRTLLDVDMDDAGLERAQAMVRETRLMREREMV